VVVGGGGEGTVSHLLPHHRMAFAQPPPQEMGVEATARRLHLGRLANLALSTPSGEEVGLVLHASATLRGQRRFILNRAREDHLQAEVSGPSLATAA
jgi:hypothetical protein